jgi:hypothetical protein
MRQSYVHKRKIKLHHEKKLIAGEIREDWTFTITFPFQRKMLSSFLKKEASCCRSGLVVYVYGEPSGT